MPTYRAYLIDKDDRVESFKPVEADSDDEALAAARQLWMAMTSRSGCSTGWLAGWTDKCAGAARP
jgi:hypothetical protein